MRLLNQLYKTVLMLCLGILPVSVHAQSNQLAGTWSNLFTQENGINGSVNALAIDTLGNIYVGGSFDFAGGEQADNIAVWNGASWQALGAGFDGVVSALLIDWEGNLYAGGRFTSSGPVVLNGIGRWDGNEWSPLGIGFSKERDTGSVVSSVRALGVGPNGELFAGGDFTHSGEVMSPGIAVWKDGLWSDVGGGVQGRGCLDLTLDNVNTIHVSDSGLVYVGGDFRQAGNLQVNGLAEWDGANWGTVGSGVGINSCENIYSIEEYENSLFVGGAFVAIDSVVVNGIAEWNGSQWGNLEGGMSGDIFAVQGLSSTDDGLYVAGRFAQAGTISANNVAKWTSTEWQALSSGIASPGFLYAIKAAGRDVYVGGFLVEQAGTHPSFGVARWTISSSVHNEPLDESKYLRGNFEIYPNPILSNANIEIELIADAQYSVGIYDLLGRLVEVVHEGYGGKGVNLLSWGTRGNLPGGVYIVQLRTEGNRYHKVVSILP
ncbi:MAG: T9SS type A sorting domain-containing protein [Bacteroidota bacterium]